MVLPRVKEELWCPTPHRSSAVWSAAGIAWRSGYDDNNLIRRTSPLLLLLAEPFENPSDGRLLYTVLNVVRPYSILFVCA